MPNEKPITFSPEQIKVAAEYCARIPRKPCVVCPLGNESFTKCQEIMNNRVLTLEAENADLRAQLAESERRERETHEGLKRKCSDELRAVKCICDIETYLMLNSPKYIKKTIDAWRGATAQEGEAKE